MDPGVPTAYKSYYLKRTLAWAVDAAEEDTDTALEGLHLRLHQGPCLGLGVMSLRSMCVCVWHLEKDTLEVCPWGLLIGFAKGEEVVKITKAAVEMAYNLNLGIDGWGEEPLEVVPEELTYEELLEPEQEYV